MYQENTESEVEIVNYLQVCVAVRSLECISEVSSTISATSVFLDLPLLQLYWLFYLEAISDSPYGCITPCWRKPYKILASFLIHGKIYSYFSQISRIKSFWDGGAGFREIKYLFLAYITHFYACKKYAFNILTLVESCIFD